MVDNLPFTPVEFFLHLEEQSVQPLIDRNKYVKFAVVPAAPDHFPTTAQSAIKVSFLNR